MKPRVMSLVLFTCMVGLIIAPNNVSYLNSVLSLIAVAGYAIEQDGVCLGVELPVAYAVFNVVAPQLDRGLVWHEVAV